MTQRLGDLASRTAVVSGGAPCACARGGEKKITPVGQHWRLPFRGTRRLSSQPCPALSVGVASPLFNATLSDSKLQARHRIRSRRTKFCWTILWIVIQNSIRALVRRHVGARNSVL